MLFPGLRGFFLAAIIFNQNSSSHSTEEILVEVGVQQVHSSTLVSLAMEDSCHVNNPRPMTGVDFLEFFQGALSWTSLCG